MWLRPQGYAVITSPDHGEAQLDGLHRDKVCPGQNEYDTAGCGHCGRHFHVGARNRPEDIGGLCKVCMKLICPFCLDQGCTPLERQIELVEERDRILRSYRD